MTKWNCVGQLLTLACIVALSALSVSAQVTFTNADLGQTRIPGAITNADLSRLEPIPVQEARIVELPRADMQSMQSMERRQQEEVLKEAARRALVAERDRLQAELDYALERLDFAYSTAGGGFTPELRPGLLSKLWPRLSYLRREIELRNREITRLK